MITIGKKNKLIVIFALFSLLASVIQGLHVSKQHNRDISKQCCASKGGFECGKVIKECCQIPKNVTKEKVSSANCVKGGLFQSAQYCPGQKITQECTYCHNICQQKKGVICGVLISGEGQCCLPEDCISDINVDLKMKKCKPGTQIKLPQCITDMNLPDQMFGKLQAVV